MELTELQNMWTLYEKKLADNTKLNKKILKRIVILKPERRLNWIKIKAVFNLIVPLAVILFAFLPHVKYRNTVDFYIGLVLFTGLSVVTYAWTIMYYLKFIKIDFSKPIVYIKKNVNELEKYKLRITKSGYALAPLFIISVFLLADGKLTLHLNIYSVAFILLTALIMVSSIYYTFRYSIYEQFRKLNKEIEEIEALEKE